MSSSELAADAPAMVGPYMPPRIEHAKMMTGAMKKERRRAAKGETSPTSNSISRLLDSPHEGKVANVCGGSAWVPEAGAIGFVSQMYGGEPLPPGIAWGWPSLGSASRRGSPPPHIGVAHTGPSRRVARRVETEIPREARRRSRWCRIRIRSFTQRELCGVPRSARCEWACAARRTAAGPDR